MSRISPTEDPTTSPSMEILSLDDKSSITLPSSPTVTRRNRIVDGSAPISWIPVGDIDFAVTDLPKAIAWTVRQATENRRESRGLSVRLSNAYCVALASKNSDYASLFREGGVTFPDGLPIAWFMRWAARGTSLAPRRVRGPSFFEGALTAGVQSDIRHFFVGTTKETLDKMTVEIQKQHPGCIISGSYAPKFGPVDSNWTDRVMQEIGTSKPDIIWVALGTPKQDYAAALLARRTRLICIGVGAAFDFKAKTVREAPSWIQAAGIEWLFRLIREPRRLWRRYLIGNLRFLAVAMRGTHKARLAARPEEMVIDLTVPTAAETGSATL